MESVEMKSSSPVSADARPVLSNSTRTAGGNTTDPPGAAPAAAVENPPLEKQKKRKKKKKGFLAFLRRIGKALKSCILCCNGDDIVTPFPCSDPTDVQPDLSGLEWALSIDPCPSGIELPVNADPADPELSSLSDISSLELTPESNPDDPEQSSVSAQSILELMSVSDISSLEMTPESNPADLEPSSVSASSILELMSVSDMSSLELTPEGGPADLEPSSVTGPQILYSELTLDREFVSVSYSLEIPRYSIELTPDSSQADLEPSPVPGPSALDSEIPGPSGLGPAFVFDLRFAENRTKKRKKRAVKCGVFSFQRENKVASDSFADEPVAQQGSEDLMPVLFSLGWLTLKTNWTDSEPFSVSGPSTLDSGITEAVGKQTKRSMKKDIRAFFQRAWRTIKSTLCCYKDNKVGSDPCGINPMDPADLQPRISGLSWVLTDPGPSYYERTSDPYPDDPEPSLVPGPSSLEPVANQDPADSQSGSVSLDSQLMLDPGPSYLVSELTSVLTPSSPVPSSSSLELTPEMGLADPKPKSIPGSSSLKLTPGVDLADPEPKFVPGSSTLEMTPGVDLADPEPKLTPGAYTLDVEPVPGPSGFWPATGSFSSFYEVKELLGSGGFATVCKGIRRFDNQMVAIKFLHKRSCDKFINLPGSTEPLLAEVAVNLLMRKPPKSPHIVQMLDWFDMPQQHIIIMEYPYPCETLLSFITRNRGFLDETVARGLMRQAVLAAKHCIDQGVFHNDIKTDNILVNTETLLLQLIDFGCSELFKTSVGHELAVQSTVWALGRVLLDMVSGDQPLSVLQKSRIRDPRVPNVSNASLLFSDDDLSHLM